MAVIRPAKRPLYFPDNALSVSAAPSGTVHRMHDLAYGRFEPCDDVPEARMFAVSGSLTVTVSSRKTGRHITLRLRCSRKDHFGMRKWPTVMFDDADRVFMDSFDGEAIAELRPSVGILRVAPTASPEARWVAVAILRYLAGEFPDLTSQADVASMSHCRRCERELTDPESIERGFGSTCWGEITRSRPARTHVG